MFVKKLQRLFAKDDEIGTGPDESEEEIDDTAGDEGADENADGAAEEEAGDEGADENADGAAEEDEEGGKAASGGQASQGRRANRVAALAERARKAEERAIKAETLAEERARQPARPNVSQEEAARQREAKLALMDAQERKEFLRDEEIANLRQQAAFTEIRTLDAIDKAAYDANAKHDPFYKKYAEQVEKALGELRAKGFNASREDILDKVAGKAMREEAARKAGKPNGKARVEAQRRTESVAGKPTPGRSNINAQRGKGPESLGDLERRLENIAI